MDKNSTVNATVATPYTVSDAARITGVSYHAIWRLCARGQLRHTRLGRKILIPARVVHDILDGRWRPDEGAL